jgi:hypothetical protein
MDVSQMFAYHNPLTGYNLCEKVAETVRRILNCQTVEDALALPGQGEELKRHPDVAFVEKVYNSIMNTVVKKEDAAPLNKFPKKNGNGKAKPVCFRTFWKDGFILYRNFVCSCSQAYKVPYHKAIERCVIMGTQFAKTKDIMRGVIKAWDTIAQGQPLDDNHDEDWIVDQDAEQFWSNCKSLTYEEWCQKELTDKDPCSFDHDHNKLLGLFRKVLSTARATQKKRKEPVTRRPAGNKKGHKKKKKREKAPPKNAPKQSSTVTHEDLELGEADDPPQPVMLPLHVPASCPDPGDEWLIIEVPYFACTIDGTSDPVLVGGEEFAPTGSSDLKNVIAIKVDGTLTYTMERADALYHGQVPGSMLPGIKNRCEQQGIHFTKVVPNPKRMFSMDGVKVIHSSHRVYEECFQDLKIDPVQIHSYLKHSASKADKERGAMQCNLGISTQNFEHDHKTPEDSRQRLLDAPNWVGTDRDFETLGPLIRDVVDCLQDFVDTIYPKPNRKLNDEQRTEMFADRVNVRLGCSRNRMETITASISYLDPRTYGLKRHLDDKNCQQPGYEVTAIWSTTFWDVDSKGNPVLVRLSIITYTRSCVGSYMVKTNSYVSSFRSLIEMLLKDKHYERANCYKDLNLAQEWERRNFEYEEVWKDGKSPSVKIHIIKLPMFLDPSGWLSGFAWCITRLRKGYSLSKLQVVELCYLATIQSSSVPFVWITNCLLREPTEERQGLLDAYNGCMSHLIYAEMLKRSGRDSVLGGYVKRHQTCMQFYPGQVKTAENTYEYTEESLKELHGSMENLLYVIKEVSDPMSDMTGYKAVEEISEGPVFQGKLNSLKLLPLAAFVGLFDIRKCFHKVLEGKIPDDKPHGLALRELGCCTHNDEVKFIGGINEWLGQPREYFFHGDHALCMAQGYHHQTLKWDPFYPRQTLLQFVETTDRKIGIVRKVYGNSEWEAHSPHNWDED